MIFLIFYFTCILQFLIPDIVYLTLIIAFFTYYDQILKKKDNLFKIFLILLPTLSPFTYNNFSINNIVYLYNISIDPILIACFFYFYRILVGVNYRKLDFIFILYIVLFVYALIHLFYIYFDNQQHNQGLTYAFRAILYLCPIFVVYNNNYIEFKKQILAIIKLSIFLIFIRFLFHSFDSVKITGHLLFLAATFPALIVAYKINLINLLIYLLFIFLVLSQSFTVIGIALLTSLLIFLRKFSIISNKFNFIFIINFQIIVVITSLFYFNYFVETFSLDIAFNRKLLLDRFPLFISTIQNIEIFQFKSKELFIHLKSNITTDYTWASGAHNYFLTIASKLGLLPAFVMFIVVNIYIIRLYNKIRSKFYLNDKIFILFYISLISSYAVFSTTGNAYAEVTGLFFYLLLGALNSVVNSNVRK